MSFIAGIVRHDSLKIPDDWVSALAETSGQACEIRWSGTDAVFLTSADAAHVRDDTGLLICVGCLQSRERIADGRPQDTAIASHVTGDFALAEWTQATRRLVLRRSHLGTRSLFYVAQDDFFAFASNLPALLALPCVSPMLDEGAIARTLCMDGSGPANDTYYAHVKRVPGGHCLTLDGNTHSLQPLPTPWGKDSAMLSGETADPADALRSLLVEAVESRLEDGKTIAVHLSGGLDSSAIACIAARRLKQQGRRLIALCSVLPTDHVGPELDERRFIDAVLAQEDTIDPVWVTLPAGTDPLGALPRWFQCLGEPSYSNVTHAEEMLGAIGRQHGVDIVLSGFGGDFFASARGVPTGELHVRRGRISAALAELRHLHRLHGTGWWQLLRDHVVRPLARWRFRLERPQPNCAAPALLDRVMQRDGRKPAPSMSTKVRQLPHQEMDFLLEPGHLERALPGICQVFAESFGQDMRFPLLDTRVIALLRALPEEELHRDGEPRSLFRRATAGILPETVRLRPDKGPAFDPALAAHCATVQPALRRWAEHAAPQCWDYVDRTSFLAALDTMKPSDRDGWPREMFSIVLTGGRFAKFIDWHVQRWSQRP